MSIFKFGFCPLFNQCVLCYWCRKGFYAVGFGLVWLSLFGLGQLHAGLFQSCILSFPYIPRACAGVSTSTVGFSLVWVFVGFCSLNVFMFYLLYTDIFSLNCFRPDITTGCLGIKHQLTYFELLSPSSGLTTNSVDCFATFSPGSITLVLSHF